MTDNCNTGNRIIDLGDGKKIVDLERGNLYLGEGKGEVFLYPEELKWLYCTFVREPLTKSLFKQNSDLDGIGELRYDNGNLNLIDTALNSYDITKEAKTQDFDFYRYIADLGVERTGLAGGEVGPLNEENKEKYSILNKICSLGAITLVVTGIAHGALYTKALENQINPDKITLRGLSKDPTLIYDVDYMDKTLKVLPTDIYSESILIKNPDKKGIDNVRIYLEKYIIGDNIDSEQSKTSITDDDTDIENLKNFFNLNYIDYKTFDKDLEEKSETIEISYKDFLDNEKDITGILKLDKTQYPEYRNLFIDNIQGNIDLNFVPYDKFCISNLSENGTTNLKRDRVNCIILDENGTIDIRNVGEDSTISPANEEEYKKFKNLFLGDMAKIEYFKQKNGVYIPTEKFNKTVDNNPKKLLEDMFRVVERRLDYDYKKLKAIDNGEDLKNFEFGLACYENGKGVCSDYAKITEVGWTVLQEYSPKLEEIRVFEADGIVNDIGIDEELHAWNGIKYGKNVTYVDLTWDDNDVVVYGIPIYAFPIDNLIDPRCDISAMDNYHYFPRQ